MNRIEAMFAEKKRTGGRAFIPYITAGFPDMKRTERIIGLLEKNGADLIELGIPFSDPIADGPTIQKSSAEALAAGTKVAAILDLVRRVRCGSRIPMLFMTAYNPIYHYGLERFTDDAGEAGIDAFLVPDLPLEESGELESVCRDRDLPLVYLVAPTTPPERRKQICSRSRGFVYYISLKGVTGERASLPADLEREVQELHRHSDLPIAVGFGISKPEHARQVARIAEGVIVGSAIVKRIDELRDEGDWEARLGDFVAALAGATHEEGKRKE